jgi:hypothetical protein
MKIGLQKYCSLSKIFPMDSKVSIAMLDRSLKAVYHVFYRTILL